MEFRISLDRFCVFNEIEIVHNTKHTRDVYAKKDNVHQPTNLIPKYNKVSKHNYTSCINNQLCVRI